nr:MAG TPA: hypothetical protein [Caudoviricetes sp.]
MYEPVRKADDYWEVTGRLIDNDYRSVLDTTACMPGMTTRFQSVAMPELHEEGQKAISVFLSSYSSLPLSVVA